MCRWGYQTLSNCVCCQLVQGSRSTANWTYHSSGRVTSISLGLFRAHSCTLLKRYSLCDRPPDMKTFCRNIVVSVILHVFTQEFLTVTISPFTVAPSTCFAMSLRVPFKDSSKNPFILSLLSISLNALSQRMSHGLRINGKEAILEARRFRLHLDPTCQCEDIGFAPSELVFEGIESVEKCLSLRSE